jgi:hypothetical protein
MPLAEFVRDLLWSIAKGLSAVLQRVGRKRDP